MEAFYFGTMDEFI
jgi:hypothetical protein